MCPAELHPGEQEQGVIPWVTPGGLKADMALGPAGFTKAAVWTPESRDPGGRVWAGPS